MVLDTLMEKEDWEFLIFATPWLTPRQQIPEMFVVLSIRISDKGDGYIGLKA